MIVDSNAAAPLKYTDPTFQSSLFVRARIYDTSGVSPVLENTVNLSQINNGTYWGKYTYTAGKTYLVQKLVFTDGTYTTVDQTYAQDNDDVQCIDLKLASQLTQAHFDTVIGTPVVSIAADIAAIPTNPLLTTDGRLAALDATISSRLAAASYTAPDNADIVAIKAQTDQFTFSADGVNAHVTNVLVGGSPVPNPNLKATMTASRQLIAKASATQEIDAEITSVQVE
jgi:hypothetical protein